MKQLIKISAILIYYIIFSVKICFAQSPSFEFAKFFRPLDIEQGYSYANDLKIDAEGYLYALGTFGKGMEIGAFTLNDNYTHEIFFAKFDTLGNCIWAKAIGNNNINSNLIIWGTKFCIDNAGNFYIPLTYNGDLFVEQNLVGSHSSQNFALVKFNAQGEFLWLKEFDEVNNFHITNIELDNIGNIYLSGIFNSFSVNNTSYTQNGDRDAFLIKFDNTGEVLWINTFGGPNHESINDFAIDLNGDIIIYGNFVTQLTLGSFELTGTTREVFLCKLNANGEYLWVKKLEGNAYKYSNSMCIDSNNNIIICGNFAGSMQLGSTTLQSSGENDVYFSKLDNNGNAIWAKNFGNTEEIVAKCIKTDQYDNVYLVGPYETSLVIGNFFLPYDQVYYPGNGGFSSYIVKTDPDGNYLWAKPVNAETEYAIIESFAIDEHENTYYFGNFHSNISFDNIHLTNNEIYGYETFFAKLGNMLTVPPIYYARISGTVYEEDNEDCTMDEDEHKLQGKLIKASPGNHYAISNRSGNYTTYVPVYENIIQTYYLQANSINEFALSSNPICPANNIREVTVSSPNEHILNQDFGYKTSQCHFLKVHLSSNRRRRCFENLTIVKYENKGTVAAENAYIYVEFPAGISVIDTSGFTYVDENTIRFELGTLLPGASGQIYIRDYVDCTTLNFLGKILCTKASIFPANDCLVNEQWNKADVDVNGTCLDGNVFLDFYNKGMEDMTDSVKYDIYIDSIFVKTGNVMLQKNDSLKMRIVANDNSVYTKIDQVENHPSSKSVAAFIEDCTNSNNNSNAIISKFPQTQRVAEHSQCLPIIGAYDPNDKQVFPIGFTSENIVDPDTRLEYIIRFQNTGNDTAFTVFIMDTLSIHLDPESIELGASSHQFELSMFTFEDGRTALRFQFDNILLPDSTTNEPESNGFVQFWISPKPNLELGTKVYNGASIYFDFNEPIFTNETITTFDIIKFTDVDYEKRVIVLSTKKIENKNEINIKLYPNPIKGGLLTAEFNESGNLSIYSMVGQKVYQKDAIEGKQSLYLNLQTGIYVARFETRSGVVSKRLIVL